MVRPTIYARSESRAPLGFGGAGVVAAAGDALIRWGGPAEGLAGLVEVAATVGAHITMTYAGLLRNLFGRISAALGAGITVSCTVRVNQVNTALTFNFSGAVQVTGSDLVNSVVVAPGDVVALGLARVAGIPPNVRWSLDLELVRL